MSESHPEDHVGGWHESAKLKKYLVDVVTETLADSWNCHPLRIEIPVPKTDALAWLHAQQEPVKTYWRDRAGAFEMAGLGVAETVTWHVPMEGGSKTLFDLLRRNLSCAHPNLRYYGGISFCPAEPLAREWAEFGYCRFVVPRFEMLNRDGQSFFVCNARCDITRPADDELAEITAALHALPFRSPSGAPILADAGPRSDVPDARAWDQMMTEALAAISEGALAKIVLGRMCTLDFGSAVDAFSLLRRLKKKSLHCYLFCFQPRAESAFLGASPEQLYKCVGAFVQSEALAATRARGDSRAADNALAHDLLHSEKELREHQFVIDSIQRVFAEVCREMRCDKKTSLVKLRECQHLVCHFEGLLDDARNDADLLDALHPTPAIAGHPTREAVQWITRHEPFTRGWYAGPVGWVGYDSSEFAMGIRSARIDHNRLALYSGAGIVEGSVPSQEWAEIETKLTPFLNVLTAQPE